MTLTFQPSPPDHVPPELIVDFDYFKVPVGAKEPADIWLDLERRGVPRIFYTRHNGGHWVLMEYAQIVDGYRNYSIFSNYQTPIPPIEPFPVVQPQGIDPPEHKVFRSLLAPLFTPVAVRRMTDEIHRRAAALIQKVADKGQCEFMSEFAECFPTSMFLYLFGLPEERLERFRSLSQTFFRSTDPDIRSQNIVEIYAELEALFRQKQQNPQKDIASYIVTARTDAGNPYDWTDILNCGFLLFVAGLDTVSASLGLIWRYLAQTPEAQQYFRDRLDEPESFLNGVEELLRINAVANLPRRISHDCEYGGVTFKKNDRVVLSATLANRDPRVFLDPQKIDLNREVNVHVTFGVGPHRCIGSILAKREIVAALQEWFRRIPSFDLIPNQTMGMHGGANIGFTSLKVRWPIS